MTSSNDTGMEQGVVGTAGAVGMQQQHLLHQQHPQPHHPHQWPLPPGAGRTMVTSLARQVAVQPPQHQPQPLPPPHQQHALSSSGRHLLPSGGPPQGPPAGGGQAVPYIGAPISLISKSEIRYEGTLYTIDTKESTVALQNVRHFGTEGRRGGIDEIPPSSDLYEFIIFRGGDIKDLKVLETRPQAQPPPVQMPPDPAIVQAPAHFGPTLSHPQIPYNFPYIANQNPFDSSGGMQHAPRYTPVGPPPSTSGAIQGGIMSAVPTHLAGQHDGGPSEGARFGSIHTPGMETLAAAQDPALPAAPQEPPKSTVQSGSTRGQRQDSVSRSWGPPPVRTSPPTTAHTGPAPSKQIPSSNGKPWDQEKGHGQSAAVASKPELRAPATTTSTVESANVGDSQSSGDQARTTEVRDPSVTPRRMPPSGREVPPNRGRSRTGPPALRTRGPGLTLPAEDFDFIAMNEKFDKASIAETDSAEGVMPKVERKYDKSSSFFDNITTEKDVSSSNQPRRNTDMETFGETAMGRNRFRGGRGGRGRGGYSSMRGRGGSYHGSYSGNNAGRPSGNSNGSGGAWGSHPVVSRPM